MLGFGVGISHCGIRGGVSDAPDFSGSAAKALLAGESQGLAFDFTDNSAYIIDTGTPANNYDSTGIVNQGSLVGPSGKLTYTSPSNKLTRQSDGYYKYQAHNLVPVSATYTSWTKQFAGDSVALSGNADPRGTATHVLTCNGASGVHALYYNNTVAHVAGATYTNSVVVKKGTLRYIQIAEYITVNGNAWANFDLDTGLPTGTQGSQTTPSVTDLGGGYFLCAISYPAGVGTTGGGYIIGITSPTATRAPTTTAAGTYEVGGFHIRRTPSNDDYIETAGAAKYALPLEYDTSGTCLGLLVEEARTNLCLYSNDLTQAGSWTASNMTTAKTATGPDNVANSATTITASAGNATVLQAITSASAARVTSVFIKRRTGTGNIDLTQDNGSTWTTQAVDSTWTRFSLSSVTSANPTVGIRIVTSGDAVDVALFSHEVGAFVTSPILTYGAAATRAADNISIATSAFPFSSTVGSLLGYATSYNATSALSNSDAPTITMLSNGSSTDRIGIRRINATNGVNGLVVSGGSVQQNATTGTWANAASKKASQAWQSDDAQIVFDGTAGTQDTSVTLPTITTLFVGSAYDGMRGHWGGIIKAISYVPRRKTDAELQAETA